MSIAGLLELRAINDSNLLRGVCLLGCPPYGVLLAEDVLSADNDCPHFPNND
jgi:hypothetical protein